MQSIRPGALALFLALGFAGAAKPAHADDACIDFKWDVSKERALFAGTATALKSAKESTSAPAIMPNRLYRLRLAPQDQVMFAVNPAKKAPAAAAFGGMATLKIAAAGAYRIAIDLPVWIDVVSSGGLVSAKDFEGQRNCSAPHKIVEFDLSGEQPFILQFSGGMSENILLTVTASPVRKL
jgi:hypothetical protein